MDNAETQNLADINALTFLSDVANRLEATGSNYFLEFDFYDEFGLMRTLRVQMPDAEPEGAVQQ